MLKKQFKLKSGKIVNEAKIYFCLLTIGEVDEGHGCSQMG
jgi:hypothetical protein